MRDEAIQEYKQDDLITKLAKNERKFMYRGPDDQVRDKIKSLYGRYRKIWPVSCYSLNI